MRRLGLCLAVLLVASGLVPVAASAAPAAPPAAPSLAWESCAGVDGVQCSSLAVPLDRADPARGTVTVGLSRLRHTAGPFLGTVVVDVGGPGGSGAAALRYGLDPRVLGGAARQYDWVGLDPRGVGSSRPRLSCNQGYLKTGRPAYRPGASAGNEKRWRTRAATYAAACADTAAKRRLVAHMTTDDTVADLESLREALGQDDLNYYGFSYGSYVGQVYATRHADRVGRFVLDGVVDPTRVWYHANLDQDVAFEAAIDAYWGWLAERSGTYQLGTTAAKVEATYERLLTRLAAKPYRDALGPAELADVVLSAGYSVGRWSDLGYALKRLYRTGDGSVPLAEYRRGFTGAAAENAYAGYLATECTDAPWPDWATTRADTVAVAAEHPFLTWSNTWYNAPCADWEVPARTPVDVGGSDSDASLLLVSETGDAATPFSGAVEARRRFPTSRLVAGVGGTSHAVSLGAGPCVRDAVTAYLADGTLPERAADDDHDLACAPVGPDDGARSAARLPGR